SVLKSRWTDRQCQGLDKRALHGGFWRQGAAAIHCASQRVFTGRGRRRTAVRPVVVIARKCSANNRRREPGKPPRIDWNRRRTKTHYRRDGWSGGWSFLAGSARTLRGAPMENPSS